VLYRPRLKQAIVGNAKDAKGNGKANGALAFMNMSKAQLKACLAFIFLTPKAWFEKREKLATQTARLIVKAQDFSPDKSNMERQIRELSGNENAEILEWRETKNANGDIFYEVDIR
jgi:hypothetical protein